MQQHGRKYFTRRTLAIPTPPPFLGLGSKFSFFRTWSCCKSNKIEPRMQQHAHTYSVLTYTLDPLGGVKGQNIFFSERSHVAYQIRMKWRIGHHASTYSVHTHTHTLNLWVL